MEGARGLAVLMVFFTHFHANFGDYVATEPLSLALSQFLENIGHSGADWFFVLSGYLIYGIVIRKPLPYRKFLWRRIRRIYPTFLSVLAIYLTLSVVFPEQSRVPQTLGAAASFILQNILLLPGICQLPAIITVAWTLSYEFFFYLTMPLLVSATGMRSWERWKRVLFFLTLVTLYLGYCLAGQGIHIRFLMFGSGILLYEALTWPRLKGALTYPGDVVALFIFVGSFMPIYWLTGPGCLSCSVPGLHGVPWASRVTLMFISFFILGLFCFGFDGPSRKLLSWTPLRWLGNMSYSYYLIHGLPILGIGIVVKGLRPATEPAPILFWVLLPCSFMATLVTAFTLFTLVEKPFSLGNLPGNDSKYSFRVELKRTAKRITSAIVG
jgi:peptidoglycan/LPS O-acetylase OafA/YrhL